MKDLLSHLPSINKEGYIFIAIFLAITIGCFFFSKTLGVVCLVLTVWCVCFFRDPHRAIPMHSESLVLSPADGLVEKIELATIPPELNMGDEKRMRVSIFLSVFDVHVNRVPISGNVTKLHYHPGQFISATLDKSSSVNERQLVVLENSNKQEIIMVQIAGLLARRIVCNLDENQTVEAGDRFGIIRFGSRVDVYLPNGVEPNVYVGQRMVGGQTVIANLTAK